MDTPEWGKYALETLRSREQAEARYRWWSERAKSIPGAEVRVWARKDPLGGELFMLMTQTRELMPEEWRRARDETVRRRIAELQRTGVPEDCGALDLAARMLGMPPKPEPPPKTDPPPKAGPPRKRHTVEELEARLQSIEERLKKLRSPESE